MKNIVICCDGTGNEYGINNTNVVEIYSVIKKSKNQLCFYDPGIGTGGWVYDEQKGNLNALHDQATGTGLEVNVKDAYRILMQTYEEGDRVFLFGFSRGAFTVRSLAGMVYKCGVLNQNNDNLLDYAFKIYCSKDNAEVAKGFKSTFSRLCPVYFVGVWDTVESLLMNAKRKFQNAVLNPEVTFGYQALSIDEKRKDFPPYLWDETEKAAGQTLEQVWFAGVHSDVGGWYPERGLANISLHWMANKAIKAGLEIDTTKLALYQPDPHDMIHESYSGFWKFRGKYVRKIEEGSCVHASVLARHDRTSNKYQPENLPKNMQVVND